MEKQETESRSQAMRGNQNAVKHGKYRAERREAAGREVEFFRLARKALRLLK